MPNKYEQITRPDSDRRVKRTNMKDLDYTLKHLSNWTNEHVAVDDQQAFIDHTLKLIDSSFERIELMGWSAVYQLFLRDRTDK